MMIDENRPTLKAACDHLLYRIHSLRSAMASFSINWGLYPGQRIP